MKLLLLLLVFSPNMLFSQCDTTNAVSFPDIDAQFPGGTAEMKKYIQNNIEYPEIRDYACHQYTGRIYLKFIVCEDGSIHNVICERCSDTEFDKIAIDLVNEMPNWTPAEVNDLPVSSTVRLPITICLH